MRSNQILIDTILLCGEFLPSIVTLWALRIVDTQLFFRSMSLLGLYGVEYQIPDCKFSMLPLMPFVNYSCRLFKDTPSKIQGRFC